MPERLPRSRRAAWVLFLVALALRTGWVAASWIQNGPALSYPDEELHWSLARNLDTRGVMVGDDGRYAPRMPAYPLFLALFAWLGTPGILLARLAQAVIGAAVAPLVFGFIQRVGFPLRSAVVGGLLVAVDPFATFFANLLLIEAVFAPLAMALVVCAWSLLCRAEAHQRMARFGFVGAGALAIMTRPEAIGFVWLIWLVTWWRTPRELRREVGPLLLLSVALAVCLIVPWGLRNQILIDRFALLSANGGVTLYDAQGPQADGSSNQAFLKDMPQVAALPEGAQDAALRNLAIEQMQRDPARVAALGVVKFLRTWSPFPNVAEHRHGVAAWAGALYTLLVLGLAFAGTWRGLRSAGDGGQRRRTSNFYLLVWLPVLYFTLVTCIFVGSVRYRVPLMPFVAAAAGTVLRGSRRGDSTSAATGPDSRPPSSKDHRA